MYTRLTKEVGDFSNSIESEVMSSDWLYQAQRIFVLNVLKFSHTFNDVMATSVSLKAKINAEFIRDFSNVVTLEVMCCWSFSGAPLR